MTETWHIVRYHSIVEHDIIWYNSITYHLSNRNDHGTIRVPRVINIPIWKPCNNKPVSLQDTATQTESLPADGSHHSSSTCCDQSSPMRSISSPASLHRITLKRHELSLRYQILEAQINVIVTVISRLRLSFGWKHLRLKFELYMPHTLSENDSDKASLRSLQTF